MATSLRLSFDNSDVTSGPRLKDVVPALAKPFPSAELSPRTALTGFWVELLDRFGTLLYRLDVPSMLLRHEGGQSNETAFCNSAGEREYFSILVPDIPEAIELALFAPPLNSQGLRPRFGEVSRPIGRYRIFEEKSENARIPMVTLPSDICGDGRGKVISVTQALHHDRVEDIYNLIVLAEGYTSDEQDVFRSRASAATEFLMSRPPLNSPQFAASLNIFWVEVASNVAGINNPNNTYFGAEQPDPEKTLVTWNEACVTKVCDTLFSENSQPYWHWAGLICNDESELFGTASGLQFAQSSDDRLPYVFHHEFGHSGFDLGDEYGTSGSYSGGEPSAPNLTIETGRDAIKWRHFIKAETSIPTLNNPSDCSEPDDRDNPVTDATVGLYAGGGGSVCGIFHPQYTCAMNDAHNADGQFCDVCLAAAGRKMMGVFNERAPHPGVTYYSPRSQEWSSATVATNVVNIVETLDNPDNFDAIIRTLLSAQVDAAVRALFPSIVLPNALTVYEMHYDAGDESGLWYLLDASGGTSYFVRSFTITVNRHLQSGELAIPDFPRLALFSSVLVGRVINIFSIDNRKMYRGVMDRHGEIEGGTLLEQSATNLGDDLISIDSVIVEPQIWVAVVDGLVPKLGAFQLSTGKWAPTGFVSLPGPAGDDFYEVRLCGFGEFLYVAARSSLALFLAVFNTRTYTWSTDWQKIPIDSSVDPSLATFDIAANSQNCFVVIETDARLLLGAYDPSSSSWSNFDDVTGDAGLTPGQAITSLSATTLERMLHVTALVNQDAQHAIYNTITGIWTKSFEEIGALVHLTPSIGGMSLHATDSQVYLALTEM